MSQSAILPSLFLAAASLLALWYLLRFTSAPPSAVKSAVKTGAVALLVPFVALSAPGISPGPVVWLVLAGLALGALGDYFLSRPGEAVFLAGMGAFAGGHLAYAAAFWALGQGVILWPFGALALAALALGALVFIAPKAGRLAWPVRGYILVILAMVLCALTVAGPLALPLGAVLFMASDFVLALVLFVLPEGRAKVLAATLVWALYWPAQALIAASVL